MREQSFGVFYRIVFPSYLNVNLWAGIHREFRYDLSTESIVSYESNVSARVNTHFTRVKRANDLQERTSARLHVRSLWNNAPEFTRLLWTPVTNEKFEQKCVETRSRYKITRNLFLRMSTYTHTHIHTWSAACRVFHRPARHNLH